MNIPRSAPSHHGIAFLVNATLQPVFFSMILSMLLLDSSLLVYIFNTTVIKDHSLLDEILELAVHLVSLGLEIVVGRRLKFQRRDQSLLHLLEVEVVPEVEDYLVDIEDFDLEIEADS